MFIPEFERDIFLASLRFGILGIDHGGIDVFLMPIIVSNLIEI